VGWRTSSYLCNRLNQPHSKKKKGKEERKKLWIGHTRGKDFVIKTVVSLGERRVQKDRHAKLPIDIYELNKHAEGETETERFVPSCCG